MIIILVYLFGVSAICWPLFDQFKKQISARSNPTVSQFEDQRCSIIIKVANAILFFVRMILLISPPLNFN